MQRKVQNYHDTVALMEAVEGGYEQLCTQENTH